MTYRPEQQSDALPARIYTWGSDVALAPLRGGGQLHPHFPSIEIDIPQAEHIGILLFFGFAEPGPAFDPLFRLAELGPTDGNSDGRRRLLDFTDFLPWTGGRGGVFLVGFAGLGGAFLFGFAGLGATGGPQWFSKQFMKSLAVGWVRPQYLQVLNIGRSPSE